MKTEAGPAGLAFFMNRSITTATYGSFVFLLLTFLLYLTGCIWLYYFTEEA